MSDSLSSFCSCAYTTWLGFKKSVNSLLVWCADEINVNFEVNLLSFRVLFFERKAKYCKLLTSHFKFQDNCKLKLFLRKLVGPNWENNKLLSSQFFFSDTISETIA